MLSDNLLLDLIEESVLAHLPARRRAAKAILEALHGRRDLDGIAERINSLDLARDVRAQTGSLLARMTTH